MSDSQSSDQSVRPYSKNKGKVCVISNGCLENTFDSAQLQKHFSENGWLISEDYKDADLILLDTCGHTREAVDISLNMIREIKEKKKESSRFIVCGCLPKIEPEVLMKELEGPTSGEPELAVLDQMAIDRYAQSLEKATTNSILLHLPINKKLGKSDATRRGGSLATLLLRGVAVRWTDYLSSRINLQRGNDPSFFYLKISSGCLGSCAYCAIPQSRGPIRSKPIEKVVQELSEGLPKNFRYLSLIGTDIGPYGEDLGYTLADLLKEIMKLGGNFKIGLRNVNPRYLKTMLKEFVPLLESRRIWYMECAAESGSNRILGLMNRKYTIEEFKDCIHAVRTAYPGIMIRTQLMVGFPTETEEDFRETMRLLDDVVFDFVEVYKYSERPRTLAADMEQVPEQIKQQRLVTLYRKALLNRMPRKVRNLIRLGL